MTERRPETDLYEEIPMDSLRVLEKEPLRRRRCAVMVEMCDYHLTSVDLQKMLEAGMNIAKVRSSLSTEGERAFLLGTIDKAAKACCNKWNLLDWPIATAGTLKTCIMRVGLLENDEEPCILEENMEVLFTNDFQYVNKCTPQFIFIDNSYLTEEITVGTEITIGEGTVILNCTEIVNQNTIKAVVKTSGQIVGMEAVCMRGMKRKRPYMTNKDLQILKFCVEHKIDAVIIYYVRHVDTVKIAHQYLANATHRPLLFGAICTEEGLNNLDLVLKEVDGVLLAREFLAYELADATQFRLRMIQQLVIGKCLKAGKPLYLSGFIMTQLLQTGQNKYNELSDITESIHDGATGFILNNGRNTENIVEALKLLDGICRTVEPLLFNVKFRRRLVEERQLPLNAADAAVLGCSAITYHTDARLIIVPTVSGATIKAMCLYRPNCIIIAVTATQKSLRMLAMYRGIVPLMCEGAPPEGQSFQKTVQMRVDFALEYAVKKNWINYGHTYIVLTRRSDTTSYCDTISIWRVAITAKGKMDCSSPVDTPNVEETRSGQTYMSTGTVFNI